MTRQKFYRKSQKLIEYFNKKNINIRTKRQLKDDEINKVGKKYISKGSTSEYWKRHA